MIDFYSKLRYDFSDLCELVRVLRAPDGCPWDSSQTHESIRRNFLEEAYEACEAIDQKDPVHLREELGDVLLHVVDASDEQWRLQSQVVEELISQLGAEKTPRILIFNKADRLREDQLPRESGALFCSALKGLGLEQLVDRICQVLGENLHTVDFVLPYAQAQLLDYLYRAANVRRADYVETGIHVEAVVDEKVFGRLQEVLPPEQRRKHEEF